ncbi:lysine decarboxylase [gut metagenome]|uniref:Lysine decarboxylase n=1 Tax=gut metagenome TaxID=749906 RepID=J9H1U2_9ZZZZ
MDKIAIFCSASDEIDPVYFEKARELGVWMGQNKKTLIYGGANVGLMECVARAAKENGCPTVLGVVPTKLEQRGRVSDVLDVTFRTDNLSDRKEVMLNEADVLVALPGGVGTLDEVFTVMAAATLDYHRKQVIFYNIDGFWDDILHFLDSLETRHFAHQPLNRFYAVANDWNELTELLK